MSEYQAWRVGIILGGELIALGIIAYIIWADCRFWREFNKKK